MTSGMTQATRHPLPPSEGLSDEEASKRLREFGPNSLPKPRRMPLGRRLLQQLVHFFALMLWAAAGLALLGQLPQLAIAIVAVIIVNALFAALQEHRADRAAERLQQLLPRRVTVRREGRRVELDASDVVVGDLVLFEPGDQVPADAELLVANALSVDTSTLTGESEPIALAAGEMIYAGIFVVEGTGSAVVNATGASTRLAGIAQLTTATARPATPLSLELRRVVRVIAMIAIGVGSVFFGLSVLLGNRASDGLIFAVGVTVALVPEALLPTVTLSLAWGAEQMARRRVLVRNLEAVETLGSTTLVCTDKTGTLTLNQMTVIEAWTPTATATVEQAGYDPSAPVLTSPRGSDSIVDLATCAAQCSFGFAELRDGTWVSHGDPMEAALDVFARRLGIDTPRGRAAHHQLGATFPFDPQRRRMSVAVGGRVLVKGAAEAVLPLCAPEPASTAALELLTARGLRVLAVADRALADPGPAGVPTTADEAERDLRLVGLVAMEDPPRPDIADAISECRRAGVGIAMITGDHPSTAAAIGIEIGLRRADGPVYLGDGLPDDDAALGELLDIDGVVVARVAPEQKLRIAAALRKRGHVVAMTGDGVNDGPALSEADIGIAMGQSGTDVAREAADLVLLDDNFASIVSGIEQGRSTFLNIRRFLTYHLSDNVAEVAPFVVWALTGGKIPLALGVLQILAIDIGTDTMSAVALGAERPSDRVLERPPVTGRLMNRTVLVRAFGILGPTVATASMAAFLVSLWSSDWSFGATATPGQVATASGAAFMAVVAGQAANAFASRSSTRSPRSLGWLSNPLLITGVAVGLTVSLLVILVPPIARQFDHRMPSLEGWIVVATSPMLLLSVDALAKRRLRRRHPLK
ncbi:MAG: cation-transporting P-type ATPase [Microthrixaceae bacterium]